MAVILHLEVWKLAYNRGWPNGWQAHNYETNENTGILYYEDRPTGNYAQSNDIRGMVFNQRYANFIHIISRNSSGDFVFLRRFNLENSSFIDFDMTQYDYEFNGYQVYKDLILFDVTDSSDGLRKYIEFNFETNEISDRGTIDDGNFTIISFVGVGGSS